MTDTSNRPNRRQRREAAHRSKQAHKPDIFDLRQQRLLRQEEARYRTEEWLEQTRRQKEEEEGELKLWLQMRYAVEDNASVEGVVAVLILAAVAYTVGCWLKD